MKRALGIVLAAVLGALVFPFASPSEAATPDFLRAINLNGPTLVVDGVTFDSEFGAPDVSVAGSKGRSEIPPAVALSPVPASATLEQLVRDFVWGVDDFLIVEGDRSLHVCNAPSPAATSSLEIGRAIAARVSLVAP